MGRPKKAGEPLDPAPPPKPQDCPTCKVPLREVDHFCESCRSYWSYHTLRRDQNKWAMHYGTEPNRGCPVCGKFIDVNGFCASCDEYRAPRLHVQGYSDRRNSWVLYRYQEDARGTDRKCTKQENLAGLAACKAAVKGTGPMAQAMREALRDLPF